MRATKGQVHLSDREAVRLLRAANKCQTKEGQRVAAQLAKAVRQMRDLENPRCVACDEPVPEAGLACSGACALRMPRTEREGRVPRDARPAPNERWMKGDVPVCITTVDPYGRWFNYVRERGAEKVFGAIGQDEVLRGTARKIQ